MQLYVNAFLRTYDIWHYITSSFALYSGLVVPPCRQMRPTVMDPTNDTRLPVWLIAGTYGCGKTTLLHQLLQATPALLLLPAPPHPSEARRWKHLGVQVVVIEVLLGEALQLLTHSSSTQDPTTAADALQHTPRHTSAFLEVPADAALQAMHKLLNAPPLAALVRVHACITLVDAPMGVPEDTEPHDLQHLAAAYIRSASMLLVHRTDLVAPRTHGALLQRLRLCNHAAPILTACFGQVA